MTRFLLAAHDNCILGDPGADSGASRKSGRANKKVGEEKSRAKVRAPGKNVSPE